MLLQHLAKAYRFDNKCGNEKISIHRCRSFFQAVCYSMSDLYMYLLAVSASFWLDASMSSGVVCKTMLALSVTSWAHPNDTALIIYRATCTCSTLPCFKLSTHYTMATIVLIAMEKRRNVHQYRAVRSYSSGTKTFTLIIHDLSKYRPTRFPALFELLVTVASRNYRKIYSSQSSQRKNTNKRRRTAFMKFSRLPNLQNVVLFPCRNLKIGFVASRYFSCRRSICTDV